MTALTFQKATKTRAKARVALSGPSGSGKTYTALILAGVLGERIAVIDTEHGSASKYSSIFEFDVLELDRFDPRIYVQAIQAAAEAGYDVLVIDSMSHEWEGQGGVLELHDRATAEDKYKNSFAAWRKVTPLHNQFIEAIIASPLHVIATMRSKSEYTVEGKTVSKVGTAPKQRDGVEYEFDVVADLELDNTMRVTKSRCPELHRAVFSPPDEQVGKMLESWLSSGKPQPKDTGPQGKQAGKRGEGATQPVESAVPVQTSGPGSLGKESSGPDSTPAALVPPGDAGGRMAPQQGDGPSPAAGASAITSDNDMQQALAELGFTSLDDWKAAASVLSKDPGFGELKGSLIIARAKLVSYRGDRAAQALRVLAQEAPPEPVKEAS